MMVASCSHNIPLERFAQECAQGLLRAGRRARAYPSVGCGPRSSGASDAAGERVFEGAGFTRWISSYSPWPALKPAIQLYDDKLDGRVKPAHGEWAKIETCVPQLDHASGGQPVEETRRRQGIRRQPHIQSHPPAFMLGFSSRHQGFRAPKK